MLDLVFVILLAVPNIHFLLELKGAHLGAGRSPYLRCKPPIYAKVTLCLEK